MLNQRIRQLIQGRNKDTKWENSPLRSSRVLALGSNPMPYYVYQLVDCASDLPFYIGFTTSPNKRLWYHGYDPRSAAYQRIHELASKGIKVRLEVLNECTSGREAYDLEAFTIAINTGLVNRAIPSTLPTRGKPRQRRRA